ncbi:MAG: IMP dehydrogenase, partial [Candidatus Kerfeldbacteria bacterium]|nr:IMP dehydrogenase [Candidatus Kerfeldbacteria bacterium]
MFPLALTFDDVLLLPRFSDVRRREVDLSARLTRRLKLSLPILSSPMDTVTEYSLAAALAKEGGLGVIHKNMTPANQAAEVRQVKRRKLLVGAAISFGDGALERALAVLKAG